MPAPSIASQIMRTTTDTILDEWRLWQHAQGLSERTIAERANTIRHLLRFTGAHPLELTPENIISFTARRDISDTSRASYHASIRAYCAWLLRTARRDDDPSMRTPRPRRPKGQPRPLPQGDLELLLARANRRRTHTYILLAALAGLRVHEIAKTRGEDLHAGILTVTGKGGKTAMIPAHERIIAEAAHYPRRGYWFPSYTGEHPHVRSHAVSKAIRDTMLRAGIHGHAHQLRHWYGTTLLNEGVDLRVVQTLMRHESPATTAIYTKVDFARQVAGIGSLNIAA